MNVVLTDCNGELIESINDPKNFLHKLLPPADEASDSVLAKIDWYGDTHFNYLPIKLFLEEWDRFGATGRIIRRKNLDCCPAATSCAMPE